MRVIALPIGILALLPWSRFAHADGLAYVRVSSHLRKGIDAAQYHPLNLLDDDPETLWCETGNRFGEGEEIRFFFKGEQKIDRIVVVPTLQSARSILSVEVSDGTHSVSVEVGSEPAKKDLERSLKGSDYVVRIEEVGEPSTDESAKNVACLADVLLSHRGHLFGGNLESKMLRYDKHREKILGRWGAGQLGAPERFLLFALDGTWEWTHVPLMGGKKKRVVGEYRFRGNRLLLRKGRKGRWADIRLRLRQVEVDPEDPNAPLDDYVVITLNKALGRNLKGSYNDAHF